MLAPPFSRLIIFLPALDPCTSLSPAHPGSSGCMGPSSGKPSLMSSMARSLLHHAPCFHFGVLFLLSPPSPFLSCPLCLCLFACHCPVLVSVLVSLLLSLPLSPCLCMSLIAHVWPLSPALHVPRPGGPRLPASLCVPQLSLSSVCPTPTALPLSSSPHPRGPSR